MMTTLADALPASRYAQIALSVPKKYGVKNAWLPVITEFLARLDVRVEVVKGTPMSDGALMEKAIWFVSKGGAAECAKARGAA